MSRTNEDVVQEVVDNKPQGQEQVSELTEEETRHADKTEENQVPSTVQQVFFPLFIYKLLYKSSNI